MKFFVVFEKPFDQFKLEMMEVKGFLKFLWLMELEFMWNFYTNF
jgi:hypothetical protein